MVNSFLPMSHEIEREILTDTNSALWKAVYAPSKLTRGKAELVSIEEIVGEVKTSSLSLRSSALILLALARISKKKEKSLIEECLKFLQAVDGKIRRVEGGSKKVVKREINVNSSIMDEKSFIETSMQLENEFDADITKSSGIEAVRNSSNLTVENVVAKKLKKVVEDKKTEFSVEEFKGKKVKIEEIENEVKSIEELFIHPEILNALREEVNSYNQEVLRNNSMVTTQETLPIKETGEFDFDVQENFDVLSYEKDFLFSKKVINAERTEKSLAFYDLLVKLSKGEVKVVQKVPYEEIEVKLIK